jgi:hypothetical protein
LVEEEEGGHRVGRHEQIEQAVVVDVGRHRAALIVVSATKTYQTEKWGTEKWPL